MKSLKLVDVPLLVSTLLQSNRSIVHSSTPQAVLINKNQCSCFGTALTWLIWIRSALEIRIQILLP
jgi:hypothetical protein